jgi:hypothetical protein
LPGLAESSPLVISCPEKGDGASPRLGVGIILISCADEGRTRPEATIPSATGTTVDPTSTTVSPVSEYLPGLEARFHLPMRAALLPLIVMVPGEVG